MNRRARDCGREMMYIHSSQSDSGSEERERGKEVMEDEEEE